MPTPQISITTPQIYTAINKDQGVPVPELYEKTATCAVLSAGGACICVMFAILIAIPIMSIVFSLEFPWQEDGSVCDPKNSKFGTNSNGTVYYQPVECKCDEDFPKWMRYSGVNAIITLFIFILTIIPATIYTQESDSSCGQLVAIASCLLIISLCTNFAFSVMMFTAMFRSDSKCGESLWQYGIFLLIVTVLFVIQRCCGSNSNKGK